MGALAQHGLGVNGLQSLPALGGLLCFCMEVVKALHPGLRALAGNLTHAGVGEWVGLRESVR